MSNPIDNLRSALTVRFGLLESPTDEQIIEVIQRMTILHPNGDATDAEWKAAVRATLPTLVKSEGFVKRAGHDCSNLNALLKSMPVITDIGAQIQVLEGLSLRQGLDHITDLFSKEIVILRSEASEDVRREALLRMNKLWCFFLNKLEEDIAVNDKMMTPQKENERHFLAETCADVLDTLLIVHQGYDVWCPVLGIPRETFRPSKRAYTTIQRLARVAMSHSEAEEMKDRLRGAKLPIAGFEGAPLELGDFSRETGDESDLPSPDVLLVVTTDVEFRAVIATARQITGTDYTEVHGRFRTYYDLGYIADTHVLVVETEMGSGGPGGSQSSVTEAIHELRLDSAVGRSAANVIAVGIAFGVDEAKQSIGDILVSLVLVEYDPERVGEGKVIPRGKRPPASTKLISRMRASEKRLDEVTVRFGLILTGARLIDNLDYRDSLIELAPEAIGGEMEGSGVFAACHDREVQWLVVKSICDWADGKKAKDKDVRQHAAAMNAARLVLSAIQQGGLSRRTQ